MEKKPPYTIVAADDHAIFLQGLASLFEDNDKYNLIKTCENGDDVIRAIIENKPDFLLLDLSMLGATPSEILKCLDLQSKFTHAIALTMSCEAKVAWELLRLGLSGYVLKEEAFDNLEKAMQMALMDECFVSTSIKNKLEIYKCNTSLGQKMTEKEILVLSRAALGMTNQDIANEIFISERTVRFHIANCCLKLEANGRTHAVAIALKNKIISI